MIECDLPRHRLMQRQPGACHRVDQIVVHEQLQPGTDVDRFCGWADRHQEPRHESQYWDARPSDCCDPIPSALIHCHLLPTRFSGQHTSGIHGGLLHYDPEQIQIEYRSPEGIRRILDAPDWIALVTFPIQSRENR